MLNINVSNLKLFFTSQTLKPILFFIIFLFTYKNQALGYSIDRSKLDETFETLEILSFNVGNAGDNILDAALPTHCPNYKLCRAPSVSSLKNFIKSTNADLLLLQETQGIEQVLGSKALGPLLDANIYDAFCDYQACVAWKKSKISLSPEGCRISTNKRASGVNCEIVVAQKRIQAISAYFPALIKFFPNYWSGLEKRRELSQRIFRGKDDFTSSDVPVIVGGDFNTSNETFDENYSVPYPQGYYTIVGRHVKGYGSSYEPLLGFVPDEDFFGSYQNQMPSKFITYSRYGIKKQIDQLFANFGFRADDWNSKICIYSGCTRDQGLNTSDISSTNDFDHFPIFGRIAFDKSK